MKWLKAISARTNWFESRTVISVGRGWNAGEGVGMETLSACYDIHCVVHSLRQIPVPTSQYQTSRKNGSGVWVPRLGMPTERHSPF